MAPRQPMPRGGNDAIARYNTRNSPSLKDGTAQEGWFYPTPAAVAKGGGNNEECYYPHFLFDSQFTYGAIHRYPQGWSNKASNDDDN